MWSTNGTDWSLAQPNMFVNQNTFGTTTGIDLSVCDGQQFYIGFRWVNNGNRGSNPPFAVDDIVIKGFPKFDYNFSYRQDEFQQITGTVLTNFVNDGENITLPVGYDFSYDGTPVTAIRANLNGWLEIGTSYSANAETNELSNTALVPFLAPLWDDLTSDGQTRIIYLVEGTSPTRTFIVEWKDVLWGSQRQNFQVKLYETSNVIEFWYGNMNTNSGGSASIGINNAGGCLNKMISITPGTTPTAEYATENNSINSATYLNNGLVYIFNPLQMQTYASWQEASVIVGQANPTASLTTIDAFTASGAICSTVSSKGVLAIGSGSANRVMIWSQIPSTDGAEANFVIGQDNFGTSDSGTSSTRIDGALNVAFSPDGNKLLIADAGNHRVLIFDLVDGLPTQNGQAASVVIGQADMNGNTLNWQPTTPGTISEYGLDMPSGLLILPNGKLLITDANNRRVLVYNSIPTTNGQSADVVIGQIDMNSNTAGSGPDGLNEPWDCAYTPEGKLLISDDWNRHRILIFNEVPTINGESAILVIGNTVFGAKVEGTNPQEFYSPSVTVSVEGKIAIADTYNNRVVIYDRVPSNNGEAGSVVLGQSNFYSSYEFNDGISQSDQTAPSIKNMKQPYSICFDLNGRLFVNGDDMHRVMIYGETPTETADLEVNIVSNETNVCIYSDIEYTVEVTNNGNDDAYSVVVNAQLPVGMTPTSYDASIGTYNT